MLRRSQADATPRRRLRRLLAATGITGVLASLMLLFTAPTAQADPAVCDIPGVSTVCDVVSGATGVASFVSDPFGFIAGKMGEGAKWFLAKVMDLMQSTSKVDFTNPGFLKQYALIFAASAILTVVLWLIAVAKRAVRGVSIATAMSEAIGLLALQVLVSAFTPAVLMLLNQIVDDLTKVFAGNAVDEGKKFIDTLTKAISATGSNAPSAMILIFLGIMVAALLVWIELLVRAGALYIGAALGPLVNSGLVDRDLWGRSKKWVGMLFALLLSKPILFALFGLAASIENSDTKTDSDTASTVLVGALMMFLAVFSSATLYKWVPSFGDDMAHLMHTRKAAAQAGPVAAIPGPVQASQQAMNARMMQSSIVGGSGAGAGAGAGGAAGAAGGPVAAAAMAAKAGMDIAKNKVNDAATIPDHGAGQGTGGEGGQDGSMPSTVRGSAGAGDSIVPTGTGTGAEAPAPTDTGAPGTATGGTPTGSSIVATGTNAAATALGSTPAGDGAADTTGPSTGSSTLSGTATSAPSTPSVVPSQPGTAAGSPSTASPSSPTPGSDSGSGSSSSSSGQPSAAPTNPAGPSTVTTGTAAPSPSPTAAQAPAPAAAPVPAGAPAPAAAAVATPPAPVPGPAAPTAARTGTGAAPVQNTAPAPAPAQSAPAAGPAIPQGSDH
ncbi:hypothetical protein ACFY4B_26530 [Kitasatospora sp. NPDC001261]|uniref:hypothetical protein n=1 Tax=Kitasatospora sp. NPDC001261 TaxID=3364012 RepID=UPI003686DB3E